MWSGVLRGSTSHCHIPPAAPPARHSDSHPLEHRGLLWQLHSRASWRRPLCSSILFSSCHLTTPSQGTRGHSLGCNTHHWVARCTLTPLI